ncbi:MAG TPA: hypothetical protein VK603_03680 [Candidatus Saccharimonadales bacterium]|nr:hypothetical protein [Candidatus Saccharimonadales bacterium]
MDEPTHAAKRYATFSADNIKAAFAKWLKVEELAEVILGPGSEINSIAAARMKSVTPASRANKTLRSS